MADDKVYPAVKPSTDDGAVNPTFPSTKSQIYGASRPPYRPQPGRHRHHRRGCCCRCCCWTILVIILLLLIVTAAAAVFYLIYRPHRPSYVVSSVKVSTLNLTSVTHLVTAISLTVTATNPNKNVVFINDPTAVTVLSADGDVIIGEGSFPPFVQGGKNTTILKTTVGSPPDDLDELSANKLKNDLKNKKGMAMNILLNTKARVKMGLVKTPKIEIRVSCKGLKAVAPTGKKATTASTSGINCKANLRFKIWKFTF